LYSRPSIIDFGSFVLRQVE